MGRFARHALGAALTCCVFADGAAAASPAFRILYHETIRPQTQRVSGQTRSMSFDAYGRRFDVTLQPNEALARAIPANRTDIEALKGQVEGQPGSWVRMTRTRSGWHGVLSDGQDLYAIEPAASVADEVVQPLAGSSGSVMYRLKDALLSVGPQFCQILNPDGTVYEGGGGTPAPPIPSSTLGTSAPRVTAQMLVDSIASDMTAAQAAAPDLKLTVGIVADYEFYQAFSTDPEGAIISRMDIVDGIWSSQVGIKIALAPLTVLKTATEPFTKTAASDLLAQVRTYRSSNAAQKATGVTHLMTGRDLDGDTVGIAYLGSVCDSQSADSLSEGNHSTLMSALIAAHELGHNFNAPHDGAAGACSTTPQTFLMAPKINFSDQFSSCSLAQINAQVSKAQCLVPYAAPDVSIQLPATSATAAQKSVFTVSFVARASGDDASNAVSARAAMPANVTVQSATAAGGGTCTIDAGSGATISAVVTCSLGTLASQESRQIDVTVTGGSIGTGTADVSVTSSNDSVTSNNSGRISIQVSADTPPPSAPVSTSGGSGSSGGGGGSLDFLALGALGCVATRAARRRRVLPFRRG